MPTFIELFAGGGLVRAGLGPSWTCLLASDWSRQKAKTYRANYGGGELRVGDVRDLTPDDVPGADLLWASFPCQDHSVAGRREGFDGGERGRLVFHVLDLIARLAEHGKRPRIVALENVLGLVTAKAGEDFRSLLTALVSVGYRVGALAVDAVHLLPHSRDRVFIVAVSPEVTLPPGLTLPKPSGPWYPKALVSALARQPPAVARAVLWWALSRPPRRELVLADLVEPYGSKAEMWRSPENVAELLKTCRPADRRRLEKARKAGGPVYGTVGMKRWDRKKENGRSLVLRTDGVANCLLGKPDLHYQQLLRVDGEQVGIRPFTAREFGRLMGVPEEYQMPSTVRQAAKLAGEGVAVPVVRWIAAHLLEPLAAAPAAATDTRALPAEWHPPRRRRKEVVAAPSFGARLKDATVGTTLYLPPDESVRVQQCAAELGVSMAEFALRGLDRMMMECGRPPVRRVPTGRKKNGARRAGEADISRMPSRHLRTHVFRRLRPRTASDVASVRLHCRTCRTVKDLTSGRGRFSPTPARRSGGRHWLPPTV